MQRLVWKKWLPCSIGWHTTHRNTGSGVARRAKRGCSAAWLPRRTGGCKCIATYRLSGVLSVDSGKQCKCGRGAGQDEVKVGFSNNWVRWISHSAQRFCRSRHATCTCCNSAGIFTAYSVTAYFIHILIWSRTDTIEMLRSRISDKVVQLCFTVFEVCGCCVE